jgi:hypothetical protein
MRNTRRVLGVTATAAVASPGLGACGGSYAADASLDQGPGSLVDAEELRAALGAPVTQDPPAAPSATGAACSWTFATGAALEGSLSAASLRRTVSVDSPTCHRSVGGSHHAAQSSPQPRRRADLSSCTRPRQHRQPRGRPPSWRFDVRGHGRPSVANAVRRGSWVAVAPVVAYTLGTRLSRSRGASPNVVWTRPTATKPIDA